MASSAKILGQLAPSATTLSALYTVPALKRATLRVIVAETGGAADTFRLSVGVGGAGDAVSQYLVYDYEIDAYGTLSSSPIAVSAGDVVRVRSTNGTLSFTATGIEQDA